MPQIGAVVINDGSATPVTYTFQPIGRDAKGVFWFEQTVPAPTNPLGAVKIGYSQTRVMDARKQLTGSSKISYSVNVPTLEVLGTASNGIVSAPTIAYFEMARIEFTLAERSTAAERKNTRAFAMNLLAHAMAVANVDTLQPSYS